MSYALPKAFPHLLAAQGLLCEGMVDKTGGPMVGVVAGESGQGLVRCLVG